MHARALYCKRCIAGTPTKRGDGVCRECATMLTTRCPTCKSVAGQGCTAWGSKPPRPLPLKRCHAMRHKRFYAERNYQMLGTT